MQVFFVVDALLLRWLTTTTKC